METETVRKVPGEQPQHPCMLGYVVTLLWQRSQRLILFFIQIPLVLACLKKEIKTVFHPTLESSP